MHKSNLCLVAGVVVIFQFGSCVSHNLDDLIYNPNPDTLVGPETNETMFDEIMTSNFTYYRDGQLLFPLGGSPHGSFKLRFNDIAASVLNSEQELPVGMEFPDGAVIVKDAYNSTGLYISAVMKKNKSDPSAGEGWLWSEYGPDGFVYVDITKKGPGCINCHANTPNRDFVLTFDLH